MKNEALDVVCKACGEIFSVFLEQMANHNAEVVCPRCGKRQQPTPLKPNRRTPLATKNSEDAARQTGGLLAIQKNSPNMQTDIPIIEADSSQGWGGIDLQF
jgi:DNA-directed RNA polymerase subunit RPC12/RpoP